MNPQSQHNVRMFAVKLAKLTLEPNVNLIYFDEASFNLWMRHRSTWSKQGQPVKMVLNQHRGSGVTVLGAIGTELEKPIFIMERSTTAKAFIHFLKMLRRRFHHDRRKIHLVLDNHAAHHHRPAKLLASNLKIELLFMPPYSPELNSIESLWSVLKRDFKSRVLAHRIVRLSETDFRRILSESLESISVD